MTERHRRGSQATRPRRANRAAIANEHERESDTGRKQADRSPQRPQPQIRVARASHARGRENKPKQANWKEQARGGRAKEKRKSHIYIGAGRRYAFIPLNRNRGTGKQVAPEYVLRGRALMKKIAPVAPKERKKQRSERGRTPTGLIGRRKQAIDREKPLEKTINEPGIRHDLKYTRSFGRNQPMKGNSHNQHIAASSSSPH